MNIMKNLITELFFVLFIFLFDSNKCSSDIVFNRPDLRLNLIIDNNNKTNEVTLKAFKSSLNDEIINKEIIDKYNQLEWYSIGYPQLNKIGDDYFVFKPNEFYVEIQMLNDPIREKFKEQILKTYNVNVSIDQVKNLELDQMNCSFEFETENGNLYLKFNGYVKNFREYPLRLNFKYGRKLKERIELEETIKKYQNKTDQLDIEIDCIISSNNFNDKFTIFSRKNSKSNEEFYKNERCLDDFEKKLIESEYRSKKIENNLNKIEEKNKEKIENIEKHLREINKKLGNYNYMKEIKQLTGHSDVVYKLVVLPNGDLASGSWDSTIKIWNINEGKEFKTLTGHSNVIRSLVVLPNGDLASGSGDETIKIWNINEGKELKTLTGHSNEINTLAVLPNGDLASGSSDSTIKIWNINEGKELKTLKGHSGRICSLVVLPNGDLASGSSDKTIKIYS